ncbi:MAG: TM2 domain-containing protein [Bacteroidales bacterium]|nr:TM2 domain-containing protein [Bacteroidales bacterium]
MSEMSEKSRVAAGVLAILLGDLGIHKFYMGKIGMGILYLLFSWTGIPALVGLIEGIIYLTESDEKFASRL